MATPAAPSDTPPLRIEASGGLEDWLRSEQLSLAFTTYQTNRLFTVGAGQAGRVQVHERLFDKPMGLFAQGARLYLGTRYQIWQLDNLLADGETRQGCDRLYSPKLAHTTGDLNVHDVVLDGDGKLLFVNTDFSCLARLSPDYSFEPVWQPPFISKLAAEDRCHLNGLALRGGKAAYVTACSLTDTPAGWRDRRMHGGAVLDVASGEAVATGLSMPHSPRWYRGRLWLLNSGTGEFGAIDLQTGRFEPLCFCPGFGRGLAFWRNLAVVGLSKLRASTFSGLALEERLAAEAIQAECGLVVIDLDTGRALHGLRLEGCVEELFDVVVLPGVQRAQVVGFQSDDIERLVTFPGSDGIVTTKPTVKRSSQGPSAPIAGLPKSSSGNAPIGGVPQANVQYQQVYHLTVENLVPYQAFIVPSLLERLRTEPPPGELFGISASVDGAMIGLAIAELSSDRRADLLSLYVLPNYQGQGIETRLARHLEQSLAKRGHLLYPDEPNGLNAAER